MPMPSLVVTRSPWLTRALLAAAGTTGLAAQSWTPLTLLPAANFGEGGNLVVATQAGYFGYDAAAGATVQSFATSWSTTAAAPGARTGTALVDTWQGRFLFGGVGTSGLLGDLWQFAPATNDWTLIPPWPSAPSPSPRYGAAVAPLSGANSLLLFGGVAASGLPQDTWRMTVLGFAVWVPVPTPAGLVGRSGHAMARGPLNTVVLWGGENGALLDDCWVFQQGWTQHTGPRPPAARDARMVYDAARDITVLLHPNRETWEWNGVAWRRVGQVLAPSWTAGGLVFVAGSNGGTQFLQPTSAGLQVLRYAPSSARIAMTFAAACSATNDGGLKLEEVDRDLPILGETLHLRSSGVLASSLFVGALELAGSPSFGLIGCDCTLALSGTGTALVYVPGSGILRDWFLPIPLDPVLDGVAIDAQGVLVDAAAPCFVMTTTRSTLTLGW